MLRAANPDEGEDEPRVKRARTEGSWSDSSGKGKWDSSGKGKWNSGTKGYWIVPSSWKGSSWKGDDWKGAGSTWSAKGGSKGSSTWSTKGKQTRTWAAGSQTANGKGKGKAPQVVTRPAVVLPPRPSPPGAALEARAKAIIQARAAAKGPIGARTSDALGRPPLRPPGAPAVRPPAAVRPHRPASVPPPAIKATTTARGGASEGGSTVKGELIKVLAPLYMASFVSNLLALGVERPSDLQYVEDADLKAMGMSVIQCRKFREAFPASSSSSGAKAQGSLQGTIAPRVVPPGQKPLAPRPPATAPKIIPARASAAPAANMNFARKIWAGAAKVSTVGNGKSKDKGSGKGKSWGKTKAGYFTKGSW
eukprot:gnl/TRDRNA2_/TRDRNA2_81071_c0_seq1.p1 gnl/TRDRNA2_/TRDRNA2_81071_c0~~gnl/TRDRNA2_/TRDRNA2_81071_c0_seq1.p1  ORF type:complete len:364 (-),score=50.66 gnl/TRDRNA2_/TRDRNA2_81071_c0_seq1:70-1161(-)